MSEAPVSSATLEYSQGMSAQVYWIQGLRPKRSLFLAFLTSVILKMTLWTRILLSKTALWVQWSGGTYIKTNTWDYYTIGYKKDSSLTAFRSGSASLRRSSVILHVWKKVFSSEQNHDEWQVPPFSLDVRVMYLRSNESWKSEYNSRIVRHSYFPRN